MTTLAVTCVQTVRGAVPVSRSQCVAILAQVARMVRRRLHGSLTIVYVGIARMRRLNATYRQKDAPTDVLSFCYRRTTHGAVITLEGDLVLARPVLVRAARQEQTSLRAATTTRIVHGVLHLLGYDHERSAKDARIMFRLQEEILQCVQKSQRI